MHTRVNILAAITPTAALVRNPVGMSALLNLPTYQAAFPSCHSGRQWVSYFRMDFFLPPAIGSLFEISILFTFPWMWIQHPFCLTFLRVLPSLTGSNSSPRRVTLELPRNQSFCREFQPCLSRRAAQKHHFTSLQWGGWDFNLPSGCGKGNRVRVCRHDHNPVLCP